MGPEGRLHATAFWPSARVANPTPGKMNLRVKCQTPREIGFARAPLVLDDDKLAKSHVEIEQATQALGDFNEKTQIYSYHIDSGAVSPNEVREKIGLEPVDGGDELFAPVGQEPSQ